MSDDYDPSLDCPVCFEMLSTPILQCTTGHSVCGKCVNKLSKCPLCQSPFSKTRNYGLEAVIETKKNKPKLPCYFHSRGCKMQLDGRWKDSHERECKFRNFSCPGTDFANWGCYWSGNLTDMYKHFQDIHKNQCLSFRTEAEIKVDLSSNFSDVQMISFHEGAQYFLYKHKVDLEKKQVFWAIQYIGLKKDASKYFYEFELSEGKIRKYKITEICQSDVIPIENIFNSGKCVMVPFQTMSNFLDQKKCVKLRFRIMVRKDTAM